MIREETPIVHGPQVTRVYDVAKSLVMKRKRVRRQDVVRVLMGTKRFKSKEEEDKNSRATWRKMATNALDQLKTEGLVINTYDKPRKDRHGHQGGSVKYWVWSGRQPKSVEVPK